MRTLRTVICPYIRNWNERSQQKTRNLNARNLLQNRLNSPKILCMLAVLVGTVQVRGPMRD